MFSLKGPITLRYSSLHECVSNFKHNQIVL